MLLPKRGKIFVFFSFALVSFSQLSPEDAIPLYLSLSRSERYREEQKKTEQRQIWRIIGKDKRIDIYKSFNFLSIISFFAVADAASLHLDDG